MRKWVREWEEGGGAPDRRAASDILKEKALGDSWHISQSVRGAVSC